MEVAVGLDKCLLLICILKKQVFGSLFHKIGG